jgi:hypothetical protein
MTPEQASSALVRAFSVLGNPPRIQDELNGFRVSLLTPQLQGEPQQLLSELSWLRVKLQSSRITSNFRYSTV